MIPERKLSAISKYLQTYLVHGTDQGDISYLRPPIGSTLGTTTSLNFVQSLRKFIRNVR